MHRRPHPILSVVLALTVSVAPVGVSSAASDIELVPAENAVTGVSSVVPADWPHIGGGLYARGAFPQEPTLLALQTAPVGPSGIWPRLLAQLGRDEIPPATGSLATDDLVWTLYEVHDVPVPGGTGTITLELALAEDHGATRIVVLQALPEEFAALRDEVFVPAVEAFAILEPEATPDPALLGYTAEEVRLPGGSPDVELAGTLTLPEGPGTHPAVVLMSGSGAQDRDESLRPLSDLKPFALIADALSSAGVAVLRYDDRGTGQSTGEYATATIEELASDGAAAIEYLRGREEIASDRIGLLGHSEGGLYAAMLAAADPSIAFVIGLAAPTTDGVRLLVAQSEATVRASGGSEEEAAEAATDAAEIMPLVLEGDAAAVESAVREVVGRLWDRTPEDERARLGQRDAWVDTQTEARLAPLLSDYFRSLLAYDPAPDWQRVRAPVLAIYGGRDVQVLADENVAALRDALEAGGNDDVETVVLPDANHLFQDAETGAPAEYASLAPEFTAGLLPTIVDWVTELTGLASGS